MRGEWMRRKVMIFRTISAGTLMLVARGKVSTEATFGELLDEFRLGDDEVSELRAKLQKGLSYHGGRGGTRHFTAMPRE
jgi:hypothetical protein